MAAVNQPTWAVAKWVPDPERNEPINIGVMLWADGQVHYRFRAQTDEETVDGRRFGLVHGQRPDTDLYKRWFEFWTHAAGRGRGLDHLARRRGGDAFFLEPAGAALAPLAEAEAGAMLDDLYRRLVEDGPAEDQSARSFKAQVNDLLGTAGLLGSPNFHRKYSIELTNHSRRTFPYAWVNGHRTVGYLLGDPTPAAIDVALFRLSHTPRDVGTVVFTAPGNDEDPGVEQIQREVGHVAPLDQVAARDVREMFEADPTPKTLDFDTPPSAGR
jgi:hypothetical protein